MLRYSHLNAALGIRKRYLVNLEDRKAHGYANSIIAMLNAGIDDAASYRLAIDSIFCHVFGHVTKSDQRALSKYNKSAPISKAASLSPKEKRIVEHVVPITVIYKKISELSDPTSSDLIEIVSDLYKVRIITATEDAKLNSMGLQYSMPTEFYNPEHVLFGDWDARHHVAGISEA